MNYCDQSIKTCLETQQNTKKLQKSNILTNLGEPLVKSAKDVDYVMYS